MRIQSTVTFSRDERQIIADAYRTIAVAFPQTEHDPDSPDHPPRVLGGLTSGAPAGQDRLLDAMGVLHQQIRACDEQSRPEFWRRQIPAEAGRVAQGNGQPDVAVPLIADPEAAVRSLCEAREVQRDEAQRAHDLIATALSRVADTEQVFDEDDSVAA